MPKIVIFGAGANGAGFIARNAFLNNYDIVFGDGYDPALAYVLDGYEVDVAHLDRADTATIDRVVGAHNYNYPHNKDALVEEVADSDLVVTAVGKDKLPEVIPVITDGLNFGFKEGRGPETKNVIFAENLGEMYENMRAAVQTALAPNGFQDRVGVVESIIHVMSIRRDQRIVSEVYEADDFVIDASQLVGNAPNLTLLPYSPFHRMHDRKLYIHNLGHMALGSLGVLRDHNLVLEAAKEPIISALAVSATDEACRALHEAYAGDDPDHFSYDALQQHRDRIFRRAMGEYLGDTNERLVDGVLKKRKLHKADRIIGAALLCMQHELPHDHILEVAAYTMMLPEVQPVVQFHGPLKAIFELTQLNIDPTNTDRIARMEYTVAEQLLETYQRLAA